MNSPLLNLIATPTTVKLRN